MKAYTSNLGLFTHSLIYPHNALLSHLKLVSGFRANFYYVVLTFGSDEPEKGAGPGGECGVVGVHDELQQLQGSRRQEPVRSLRVVDFGENCHRRCGFFLKWIIREVKYRVFQKSVPDSSSSGAT